MNKIIIITLFSIKCFSQNPDGHLIFRLLDCNKIINFDNIENETNIISDISGKFILNTTNMLPDNCGFGRFSNSINHKNAINIDLNWCESITLEVRQKSKKEIEIMKINFKGMYQKSASINIKFKKGYYEVNVKKLFDEKKIVWKAGNEIFIKQKYLKRKKLNNN